MLYLLDANVLIDADRDYYPLSRVPEFWDWVVHQAVAGTLKMPVEQFEEVVEGNGALTDWATQEEVRSVLVLEENAEPILVARVVDVGYGDDLSDDEVEKIGRDPFLISYALVDGSSRCVVTNEQSKPSTRRANRRIPDVCRSFSVSCCNTFALVRALDFSTGWMAKL